MRLKKKSQKPIEKRPLESIRTKEVIQKNSRKSLPLMRSYPTKKSVRPTTDMEKKVSSKEELAQCMVATFFQPCSAEVAWGVDIKDPRKENQCSTPSK